MKCASILSLCIAVASACSTLAAFDPIAYVEKELKAGQTKIVVPPGTYRVTPKDDVYLSLKDLKGAIIDFTGVEFIGTVNTRMLQIENCVDVTLKGLTIDYDTLPFTQARIIAVDGDKNWTVRIIEGYPNHDFGSGDSCWPIQAYDKDSLELVNPMRFRDGVAVTRVDGDTFRITGGQDRQGKVGDIAVWTCSNCRDAKTGQRAGQDRTVFSEKCVNLRIENVTVYSTRGIAFWEYGNTKAIYRNCRVARRPPETDPVKRGIKRLRSGNHDAFHSRFATVGPQIIGCYAHYHCDDCVNITGRYSIISKAEGRELRILALHEGKWLPTAGETIQIMTYEGQCPPDAKVLGVTPAGKWSEEEEAYMKGLPLWPGTYKSFYTVFTLKIDRDAGLKRGDVVIGNSRCGNGGLVKDCDFGHVRARGIITKGSHSALENNTITGCFGPGILVRNSYEWMEGGCNCDLRIMGNTIVDCRSTGIEVGGVPGTKTALPANSHRDIAITGNTINGLGKAIQVVGCTGLEISGNVFATNAKTPDDAIVLKNVEGVTKKANSVAGASAAQPASK